ncbi:hypothetical protein [Pseudomonas donghuensis]|uniref:hypothetical protein n=1 Tax=Pseudomonas donghuensis TaxID=1163398 RepID=UPI00215F3C03|nr:hypothetical protein [Pseudomonas donghuensis]UVL26200.1 hypothetical protein LOY30_09535 [Pseudomonas donghuensis]
MKDDFGMDSKPLERMIKIALCGLIVVMVIATFAYISVFNGGLSVSADKWSAFGSFLVVCSVLQFL